MSITKESITALFAPLQDVATAPAFFGASVSPAVQWTWGVPGAKHALAGKYNGLGEFFPGVFGVIAASLGGPMSISVVSVLVDGDRAAVELSTKGATKSGKQLDEQSVWLIKVEGGVITEVTSYVDSAALEQLLAEA